MSRPTRKPAGAKPEVLLARLYQTSGYVRLSDEQRKRKDAQKYKKGSEVRFVVGTRGELEIVRGLLRQVGLKPGAPFQKHSRWVQPVYGREAVDRFVNRVQASDPRHLR